MTYDFKIYDFYMMFKPFKYWGDYSLNEHSDWYSGLPENPFEETTLTKIRIRYINQIITPELQNMLELMYFKNTTITCKYSIPNFGKSIGENDVPQTS